MSVKHGPSFAAGRPTAGSGGEPEGGAVPIGRRLDGGVPAGRPAPLSPAGGPLLIFGGVSSGKTLVVKKLLRRAAVADPGAAIFATDAATTNTGYDELARVLGLSHAYIDDEVAHCFADGEDRREPASGPAQAGRLVVSGGPLVRGDALSAVLNRRLDDLIADHFHGGPPPHLFLDGADELLDHELAASLWRWVWERGGRYGVLAAAAVGDPARFLDGRMGRIFVRHAGAVLFLRHDPAEARETVRALAAAKPGRPRNIPTTRVLAGLGVGRGLLLDTATGDAEELEVDLTDDELAFFDTRPMHKRR